MTPTADGHGAPKHLLDTPIPTPDGSRLLLGDLAAFKADAIGFLVGLARQSPLVKIRFGWITRHIVSDAEMARHILLEKHRSYIKDQRLKRILESGTGPVLSTSDGDQWRWRRQLMQPTFTPKAINPFARIIVEETQRMQREWQTQAEVDIADAMKTLTMQIIGRCMFSIDFSQEAAALHDAYGDFGQAVLRRATSVLSPPLWVPTSTNKQLLKSVDTMRRVLRGVLADRRQHPDRYHDLLTMLMLHGNERRTDDDAPGLSEDQLIHEMSAIVFAGHETTANTLTWALYLLAEHRDALDQVRLEIDAVFKGRLPGVDDLKKLNFLRQVIDETMRLYPALYVNSRQAVADDHLGPHLLRSGSRALINIIGIHRNPRYWKEPDRFDPGRFSLEQVRERPRFAFIPFLIGPRKCLGAPFALLELQLVLASLLQSYDIQVVPGHRVVPEASAVLQPLGGLPMVLKPRPNLRES